MSFSQAVSGLGAASSNLDVIGNNIANSATAGFKSSTIAFADMFAGSNVGLGTKVAAVVNFAPRQIGPFMSEVLTLGFPDADGEVVLVGVDRDAPLGGRLF